MQLSFSNIDPVTWQLPPQEYRLQATAVHIYRVVIPQSLHLLPACSATLNIAERERAASYHFEKDKSRFVLSRGMLRVLLSNYLHTPPGSLSIVEGENKKPYVADSNIHYSVTHAGDVILIAVAAKAIGIDVEYLDADFDYGEVLPLCFSEMEIAAIKNSANPRDRFYTFWTRKEALLKALGKRIDDDMIDIPAFQNAAGPEILSPGGSYAVATFAAAPLHTGSVASTDDQCSYHFINLK